MSNVIPTCHVLAADGLPDVLSSEDFSWYAVQTKSQKEDIAVSYISRLGLQVFNPRMRKQYKVCGKIVEKVVPIFPCYIFARFNKYYSHNITYARGVKRIVTFGEEMIPIEERIIGILRQRSAQYTDSSRSDGFCPGDVVVITGGPLYGIEGIFEKELSDKDRVSILLHSIEWQAHVLVEKRWLEKKVSEFGHYVIRQQSNNS
jgi:transcriptional antiterminator RfaH